MLVVTIPTSPRLSKTEFVGESYCISTSDLLFDRFFENREKKKKTGRLGRPQAGARPDRSGTCPAHLAPHDRPRPGSGRTARVASRPGSGQAGLWPVTGRLPRFLRSMPASDRFLRSSWIDRFFFLPVRCWFPAASLLLCCAAGFFSVRSIRCLLAPYCCFDPVPARPAAGRPQAELPGSHFLPQRLYFWGPFKKSFFPIFPLYLFACSLSSIARHFESSIPPNPSDDSCPNLGKQERRSRSTSPPNKISSK